MTEAAAENQGHWAESFPAEVQGWDEVTNSEGSEQFWQRIGSHRKHIGNSIRLPSEEASVEDMNTFYDKLQKRVPNLMPTPSLDDPDAVNAVMAKLGMPENATGYEDITGDDISFNDGQLDSLKELAMGAGLTKSQFNKLAKQVGLNTAGDMQKVTELQEAANTKLKEEWGMTAEDRLNEANNFLSQSNAPQSLIDAMSNKQLDADTTMWLHSLSQGMSESSEASGQNNGAPSDGKLTPYEAQERINEMLNNKEHPYHRGETKSRERMRELMVMAG